MGNHPVFEVMKCVRRLNEKPVLVSSLLRLAGYAWRSMCRPQRLLPPAVIAFNRKEQVDRLTKVCARANKQSVAR